MYVRVVQELPKYLPVAGSPEKLKRACPRGNDLCWLLSGLARSARSAQGRPSFGQWEGGGREKLRYTYVFKEVLKKRRGLSELLFFFFFFLSMFTLCATPNLEENVGTGFLCYVFCKMPSICMIIRWSGHFYPIAQIP